MKEKGLVGGNRYLASGFQSECWVMTQPGGRRGIVQLKGLLARHRRGFDLLLSTGIIGGIFLLGIWGVLVQLAEY